MVDKKKKNGWLLAIRTNEREAKICFICANDWLGVWCEQSISRPSPPPPL